MPLTAAFKKEYARLNPRQKEAVDAIEGPVMVIAGPGTGKTQVLTLRIANILARTDTEPRSILALTFTEKAAFNMRERLAGLIGQAAYGVRISTFHAFCNEIIGRNPDSFPHIIGGTPLADGEQLGIIEALVESPGIDALRPAGRPESYVRSIIGAIGDAKGKGYSPKAFAAAVRKSGEEPKKLRRMTELATIFERYEQRLAADNRYDYDDMLKDVVAALERDDNLRLDLSERYQYLLVDEHQDTNRLQNRVVELIGGTERPNLFVVGDLQQAIYRFQGASPENFQNFTTRFPGCTTIRLDENYRSSQVILNAAAAISPGQGSLNANAAHPAVPIACHAFSGPGAMEFGIARLAADAIKRGIKPGDIAVLYRKNRDSEGLASAFERLRIPYAIQSDQEVLSDREIMKLLTVARAVHRILEPAPLLEALHVDILRVSPLDAAKIGQAAREKRLNPWDIMRSSKLHRTLALEEPQKIASVYEMLKGLARTVKNTNAAAALQAVVDRTNWIAHAASLPRGHEAVARLHALFDAVRAFTASHRRSLLGDFLDSLDRLERHDADLAALAQSREDAVQLMTAHKAKGLEFDLVFVANAARGHWDDARRPVRLPLPAALAGDDPDEDDEDVRRLFYVAATRARKRLHLCWPSRTVDGKDLQPSRFVLAIPEKLRRTENTAALEAAYARHATTTHGLHTEAPMLRQKGFIAQTLERQPLSVTALNNFLACPWKYYFSNLVRIPEAPTPKSAYGTAAHEAMRRFFDRIAKGERPTRSDLVGAFRNALNHAPVAEHIVAQLMRDGTEALAGWYNAYRSAWNPQIRTEVRIERVELAPGVYITGQLDKIELLDGKRVNVVDYKTKAPMSANAIKGLTKSSTGNEYRQLLFYKLLLDGAGELQMESGEIDFLEPNDSGKYKKERFPVSTEMTADLKKTTLHVVASIKDLAFWNDRCGERDCRFCRLRSLMS